MSAMNICDYGKLWSVAAGAEVGIIETNPNFGSGAELSAGNKVQRKSHNVKFGSKEFESGTSGGGIRGQ